MGELTFFLGLQIKQNKDGIFINQVKYTKELLKRFDMEASNAFDTPMSSSLKLDKDEKGKDVDIKRYRAAVFFALITSFSAISAVTNITTDEHALLSLKASTTTGWSTRVICNRHGRVASLNLSNMGLVGTIPPSMGNLSFPVSLDLSKTSFSGNIPRKRLICAESKKNQLGIQRLQRRASHAWHPNKSTRLHNQANFELLGTIPATIFNISTLQILAAVSNQLWGTLPLYTSHQLANLKRLFLGYNSLTRNLPDSISNASKLKRLDLIANNFSGIVPNSLELSFITSLTNCTKLTVLSIGENPIAGTLPVSIGNLSASLQYFYAYRCRIRGTIPNKISNLSSLIILSLLGNDLSGSIPNTIKGLQKLQGIAVHDNKLQESIPNDPCQLPNLSGPMPACLGNISSLRELYLSSNKLSSRSLAKGSCSIPSLISSKISPFALDIAANSAFRLKASATKLALPGLYSIT
ncbi:hypothetical protein RJ640_023961 [Escallonia rubra]|uniref:Uncharacterized protein n=1 Tax=Escallonia rubra TaxID=112253 RepID=A0AA88UD21_9ASTE|nr:hypothetical protein RJ640_023961 [Escallonia rubra]